MVFHVLEEMRIRSLGVIDDAVVELSPGFTAVTGETGAGKTMVVTSLGLLLGGRADPALVRIGAGSAVVEGRVGVEPGSAAARRAEEAGAQLDDGALLISRTVSAEGRSRAHLGGRSVPVGLLAELADDLVAVHGQTDQQGLLKPARQRAALDRYAGDAVAVPLAAYGEAYRRLRALDAELDELTTRAGTRAGGGPAAVRAGGDRGGRAPPRRGRGTGRRGRTARPRRGPRLRRRARARRARRGPGGPGVGRRDDAGRRRGARPEAVRSHDPALASLADRIGEISILLTDVAGELAGYADGLTPTRGGWPPSRSGAPRWPG